MSDLTALVKMRIEDTDLARFVEKEDLIKYALQYAENQINTRRGYEPKKGQPSMESKYEINKVEGAVWYLSVIGAEGYQSVSENGISVTYKEVPDWLLSVVPLLKVIRRNG